MVLWWYRDPRINLTDADYLRFFLDHYSLAVSFCSRHFAPAGAREMLEFWEDHPQYAYITLMDYIKPMRVKIREAIGELNQPNQVFLILGRRGTGKTYLAYWLCRMLGLWFGRECYHTSGTNVPGFQFIDDISNSPSGSITVIDEAQLIYDSRRSQSEQNIQFSNIIQTSRHSDRSILVVTQNHETMDLRIRMDADGIFTTRLARGRHLNYQEAQSIKKIIPRAYQHMIPRTMGRVLFLGSQVLTLDVPGPGMPGGIPWWSDTISKSFNILKTEKEAVQVARLLSERSVPAKQIARLLRARGFKKASEYWVQMKTDPKLKKIGGIKDGKQNKESKAGTAT